MSGSTISGSVAVGITVNGSGSNNYISPLTILSTGYVEPTSSGVAAITDVGGTGFPQNEGILMNFGTIIGGPNGGTGVSADFGSTITNSGYISGGYGSANDFGVTLVEGQLTNRGTISGSGAEGNGVANNSGSLLNQGTISAGASSVFGFAVSNFSATLTNDGTLIGSELGSALDLFSGSVENQGLIEAGVPRTDVIGVALAATLNEAIGVALGAAATFVNDGTILGGVFASAGGAFTDAGYISAGGSYGDAVRFGTGASTLTLDAGARFGGAVVAVGQAKHQELEFASTSTSGTLSGIGGEITGFGAIVFDPGASWTIEGDAAGLASGQTISGFAAGDTIILDSFVSVTDDVLSSGGLVLSSGTSLVTLDLTGSFTTADLNVSSSGANTTIALAPNPCFAAGTRILTSLGERAVESLRPGDVAILHDNTSSPIAWVGHRAIDIARHHNPATVRPVLIAAHALADAMPRCDLLLSPDHAIFLSGHLIPAKALINGFSIRQIACSSITYFHVELDHHAILVAENCPAESYLETGNRGAFDNGGTAIILHPDFAQHKRETQGCAPFAEAGPIVEAVRAAILDRAGIDTVADPGLNIVFDDGRAIIGSRSAIPGHITPDPSDGRRLGVKVGRLIIDGKEVSLGHPDLVLGWHDPEPDGRWTDGDAVIPETILLGSRSVEIELAGTIAYPTTTTEQPAHRRKGAA